MHPEYARSFRHVVWSKDAQGRCKCINCMMERVRAAKKAKGRARNARGNRRVGGRGRANEGRERAVAEIECVSPKTQ